MTLANVSFVLILVAWANARIARIVTKEDPGKPIRRWISQKFGYNSTWAKGFECPWCLGFWTAIPATALAWFPIMGLRMWWLIPVAWLAVTHAAGYLQPAPPANINIPGK